MHSTQQEELEFMARGLAGLRESERTGKYYSAAEVLAKIDQIIRDADEGPNRVPPSD